VHEVFTEDEIEKSDELAALISRRPLRGMQTSGATSKKAGNPSDLYRSIIRNALAVNTGSKVVEQETGEPLVVYHGTKESLRQNRVSSGPQGANSSSSSSGDIYKVLRDIMAVNPDSVSKMVDPETGKPLVVYHATVNDFSEFARGEGGGPWFSSWWEPGGNPNKKGLAAKTVRP